MYVTILVLSVSFMCLPVFLVSNQSNSKNYVIHVNPSVNPMPSFINTRQGATSTKVLRLNKFRCMTPFNKITQPWCNETFSQTNMATKGAGRRWAKFEKVGQAMQGGLHKLDRFRNTVKTMGAVQEKFRWHTEHPKVAKQLV